MKMKDGFTLVETMVVIVIIGILINVAMPNFFRIKYNAQATRIIGDFLVIRDVMLIYYGEHGEFPRDYYPGRIPKEIKADLPQGFSFNLRPQLDVRYDWENWVIHGKPKHPKTGILYGVSVTTKDKALVRAIQGVYRGPFKYSLGNNYTFVMEFIRK